MPVSVSFSSYKGRDAVYMGSRCSPATLVPGVGLGRRLLASLPLRKAKPSEGALWQQYLLPIGQDMVVRAVNDLDLLVAWVG